MAPEVMGSSKYSTPADIFSFGMVLYELIYGFLPFGGKYCVSLSSLLLQQISCQNMQVPQVLCTFGKENGPAFLKAAAAPLRCNN